MPMKTCQSITIKTIVNHIKGPRLTNDDDTGPAEAIQKGRKGSV
jgi:hypothetical protein